MSTHSLQQSTTSLPCQVPDSVDGVTSLLSQTHLTPRKQKVISRLPTQPSTYSVTDRIDQLILNVLIRDLNDDSKNERLLPDHPCFNLARQYAKKWNISDLALETHITLACGYLKFPILLLLNPPPRHEEVKFCEMLEGCPTLRWFRQLLKEIGLELADLIILDICTLLDDSRIKSMDAETKKRAMSEAYEVTWQMLVLTKPNIIISCQCQTRSESWGGGTHIAAQQLCSSMRGAKAKEVNQTDVMGHVMHVIQGYHPSVFLKYRNHSDPDGKYLAKLLRKVYLPCAIWKQNFIVESLKQSINATAKLLKATSRKTLRLRIHFPSTNHLEAEIDELNIDLIASFDDMLRSLTESLRVMKCAKEEVEQCYKELV